MSFNSINTFRTLEISDIAPEWQLDLANNPKTSFAEGIRKQPIMWEVRVGASKSLQTSGDQDMAE